MNTSETRVSRLKTVAVFVATVSAATSAWAGSGDPIVSFWAGNSQGAGAFDVDLSEAQFNNGEIVVWNLIGSPVEIIDGGATIATITSAQLTLQNSTTTLGQSLIALSFNVQAGAADTEFTISSALLDSLALDNAIGRVTGTYSVTDGNNNGATLTGMHDGGGLYQAQYNGTGVFNELFTSGPYSVGASESDGGAQDIPLAGFTSVGADVDSMAAQWHFTLTAGDLAGGTSNYILKVPAPAGAALLGFAGVFAARRRR